MRLPPSTIYRHYGSPCFDMQKYNEVANRRFCKPSGGLWAGPIYQDDRGRKRDPWREWCEEEEFHIEDLEEYFDFLLCPHCRVKTVHRYTDLLALIRAYPLQE